MGKKTLDIVIIANKANTFGIAHDVRNLSTALGAAGGITVRHADPLEPPSAADLAIHLEVPSYVWMPWATANILVINPEWYVPSAWDPYLSRFQFVVFKDKGTAAQFAGVVPEERRVVLPWAIPSSSAKASTAVAPLEGFVWFLGGSANKLAYVQTLVSCWRETYPPLQIYSVRPLELTAGEGAAAPPSNVKVTVKDLGASERLGIAARYRGHICCSRSEGFGTTAAEAEWNGAFTILNDLGVYRQDYRGQPGVVLLPSILVDVSGARFTADAAGPATIESALDDAIAEFRTTEVSALSPLRRASAAARWARFQTGVADLLAKSRAALETLPARLKHLPPILLPDACPPISIVTLLYNRRKFFDLACHNIMISDYPKEKIQWIIVEDSDDPMEDASDRVVAVAERAKPVEVTYLPLKKKTPIGEKRNRGCAAAKHDIILMMDDDDHYPETSFRRRVAWLTTHPWKPEAVAATTIACYDLVKGISAVNSPPVGLPLGQRVSEATLTFRKSWWEARGFPRDVQIGEGEDIVTGREASVLELPPQQILVAFSHGKNASSRRVPSGEGENAPKPGCFWGFPKEFLVFVHGLAGVKVVEEKGAGKGK